MNPGLPGVVGPTPSPTSAVVASRQPPPVPDYELLHCIGRGSYGDVWLTRNVLRELRAVKFVYRDCFADPRPFEREFEGIQHFEPISRSHPSQLHILHVGKNDAVGCFYYVMELADDSNQERNGQQAESPGQAPPVTPRSSLTTAHPYAPRTLRSELDRQGRLPVAECIQIGLSLATALQHLHENKLVHRDIKPSNILFVNGVAKLGDIGLVTVAGDTQSIVGTEGYLPPEGPGTPKADLYSLGKVLYEMTTGMDRRRLPELPGDLRSWPEATSALALNEVVLKACAGPAADRYPSSEAMREDLERLSEGKPIARARLRPTSPSSAALLAGILGLLVGVGVWVVASVRPTTHHAVNPSDRLSDNPEAVKEYLEGVYCARRDSAEGFKQGIAHFQKALALDPGFAMAYNGLYEIYVSKPEQPEVMECVKSMLALEPQLAEAHAALGYLAFLHWQWPQARGHFQRAIQCNPKCAIAHMRYGFCLVHAGETDEALQELLVAEQLNPQSPRIKKNLGHVYYVRRQFPESIAQYRKALELEPSYLTALTFIGYAQRAMGDYEGAIESMRAHAIAHARNREEVERRYDELSASLQRDGRKGYWSTLAAQSSTLPESWITRYIPAQAAAHLGDHEKGLSLLTEYYSTNRLESLEWLLYDEVWDPVHDDPRFIALLKRTGLRN